VSLLQNITSFFFPRNQPLDEDTRRKYSILVWLCIITGLNYAITFLSLSPLLNAVVLVMGIAGALISFVSPLLLRSGMPFFWVFETFLVGNLLCYISGIYLFGGSTTVIIVWMCAFPLLAIILTNWKQMLLWGCIIAGVTFLFALLETRGKISPATFLQDNLPVISFVLVLFFSATVLTFYVLVDQVKNRLMHLLREEKQKSDNLLLNILPEEVAEELKRKGSAEARLFDQVTVLFTDFVDFTKITERLTPQQLVDELHTCFKAYDEIISKYKIEKIKTVGDAYIAVGGMPHPNPNHAGEVVKAALEIQQFNRSRRTGMHNSGLGAIRLGVHSGSVVAGIVGVKKFAYDIWGDAVNTAARMEQSCEAGKVNVSETTYELIKDQFICEYRGEIEAKNKGRLKMYYVLGSRERTW